MIGSFCAERRAKMKAMASNFLSGSGWLGSWLFARTIQLVSPLQASNSGLQDVHCYLDPQRYFKPTLFCSLEGGSKDDYEVDQSESQVLRVVQQILEFPASYARTIDQARKPASASNI